MCETDHGNVVPTCCLIEILIHFVAIMQCRIITKRELRIVVTTAKVWVAESALEDDMLLWNLLALHLRVPRSCWLSSSTAFIQNATVIKTLLSTAHTLATAFCLLKLYYADFSISIFTSKRSDIIRPKPLILAFDIPCGFHLFFYFCVPFKKASQPLTTAGSDSLEKGWLEPFRNAS